MQTIVVFFVITTLFCLWNPPYTDRKAKVLYWVLCIATIFMIGFRGDMDRDYANYANMFSSDITLIEPAFLAIRFLVRDIFHGNIVGLMFMYALIGVSIKFFAIKRYSEFIFLSLAIWMGNLMVLQDMTQIRVSVACSILLLSVGSLYDRNWRHYFGFVLLASMFHTSALLMVLLWFLSGKRINRLVWTVVIVGGYALSLSGIFATSLVSLIPIESIQTKLQAYEYLTSSDGEGGANIFGFFQMTRIAIFLLLLWNVHKIEVHNKYAVLLLKIMACGLTALPLFRNNLAAGLRITELLTCVDILLFPMVVYLFYPRATGKLIVIIYSAAVLYGRLFVEQLVE